jgi:arylsulfatase A-like enzyme
MEMDDNSGQVLQAIRDAGYDNPMLHPNFPRSDPEFMSMWDKVNLSEWEAKPGEKPHIIKDHFNYDDLSTADDDMRAKAVDYIRAHAKDSKPFFLYLNFEKVHNPNNPSPRWKGKSPGCNCLVARPHQARLSQYRYVLPYGLVADVCFDHRATSTHP